MITKKDEHTLTAIQVLQKINIIKSEKLFHGIHEIAAELQSATYSENYQCSAAVEKTIKNHLKDVEEKKQKHIEDKCDVCAWLCHVKNFIHRRQGNGFQNEQLF